MIALTHQPSPNMQTCVRTFVPVVSIDAALARQQHRAYCQALTECGAEVRVLDVNMAMPDGAFLEDTAVVLDEVAILCSMGTSARESEPTGLEPVLREYRPVERIPRPATLEGGDVLRVGRRLFVGQSKRTNNLGIAALRSIVVRLGYQVTAVPVRGSLHLKTACTPLPDGRLLINPDWVDVDSLEELALIPIPKEEPFAGNVCSVGPHILLPSAHSLTAELLEQLGFATKPVDISEFSKAEGGVTCLSLVLE